MINGSVLAQLKSIAEKNFNLRADDLDVDISLLELGLDSLMIIKLAREIENNFGVSLSARWFMTSRPSLKDLAHQVAQEASVIVGPADYSPEALVSPPPVLESHYLAAQLGGGTTGPSVPFSPPAVTAPGPAVPYSLAAPLASPANGLPPDARTQLELFRLQLGTMQELFSAQWRSLTELAPTGSQILEPPAQSAPPLTPGRQSQTEASPAVPWPASPPPVTPQKPAVDRLKRNFRGFVFDEPSLSPGQLQFIDHLVDRHLKRTPRSRALHLEHPVLADWKSSLHYRQALAPCAYPIVASTTHGGRFVDVDGNSYLDISLGMGVNFLGHNPDYVNQALARRLEQGYGLGPQCDITAEVAEGISRLTGCQRVSFCNTGSEAVMFSMRLARAITGRPLIAIFNGSYHGTFDGVLAENHQGRTVTYSPGTEPGMVESLLVLDYGSEEALAEIYARREQLAAVLVEPVQSRKPGLQPQAFLKRLRALTKQHSIALIFDEMINGFRIAPGGAQEYFGIQADMALYGKIIGGGMPLGVVTGSAKWLDGIDGGRDLAGGPSPEVIVYGGTFCRHPMSMEAAKAAINHMIQNGPALQAKAKKLTDYLSASLNLWFEDQHVPLRLFNFGAQFIIEGFGPWSALTNPLELDIFYLLIQQKGVYVWERRTCSLSAIHDQNDVAYLINAVKQSVTEIRQAGFEFGPDTIYGAPKILRPMNPTQRRFFAISQRQGGQDALHLSVGFTLKGQVDVEALEIALARLTERHEALRTAFWHLGTELVAEVKPYAPLRLINKTVPPLTPIKELAAELIRPYQLGEAPLWRTGLFERGDDYVFIIDASHLIVDGTSLGIIIEDLNDLMANQIGPKPISLGKVEAGLQAALCSANGPRQQDLAFWANKLKDLEPLELPVDHVAKIGSTVGSQKWYHVDPATLRTFKEVSRKLGLTLNMFLNGIYALTLNRFTGAGRVVIGLTHTGRQTPDSEEAVGLFIGTVPQDITVSLKSTLASYFDSVRLAISEALEHPYAPYEELVEALGFAPITTMLSYEKGETRLPRWPMVTALPLELPTFGANYDLSLDLVEMSEGLMVNLIHSEAISPELADIIGRYYLELAKLVASSPSLTVEAAQDAADHFWKTELGPKLVNLTETPADYDIVTALEAAAGRHPDKLAVVGADLKLSYGELWTQITKISEVLAALALPRESVVGITLPRSPWYVAAMFGVLKAGLAYMPMALESPPERLKLQMAEAQAKAFLSLEKPSWLPDSVYWLSPANPAPEAGGQTAPQSPQPPAGGAANHVQPDSLAYILFTSGSTGKPKGVMVKRGGLNNLCHWFVKYFKLTHQDKLACFVPFYFDISNSDIIPALLAGAELHILAEEDRRDGARLWRYYQDHRITIVSLLASLSELLPGNEFPDLRLVLSCGEALHLPLARGPYQHYNTYGPTEFTITSHTFLLDGTNPPPIGRPVNRSQGLILDQDGRLCPPGRTGELVLSGPQISRGYLGQPILTAEKFQPNPFPPTDADNRPIPGFENFYRTGDRCRLLPSGDISYLSRFDRQFKLRGQRLEPGEVESAILNQGLASQALVTKISESGRGDLLWAYVSPQNAPIEEIRAYLTSALPAYMVPNGFTALERLPKNSNGKIDPKALPKPSFTAATVDPPQTPAEVMLAKIWANELNLTHIGREDNFFSLGGDSVKVIKVTSAILAAGFSLEASDFYLYQTLSALAKRLAPTSGPDQPEPDGPSGGPAPKDSGGSQASFSQAGLESGLKSGFESSLKSGLESKIESGLKSGLDSDLNSGLESSLKSGLESGFGRPAVLAEAAQAAVSSPEPPPTSGPLRPPDLLEPQLQSPEDSPWTYAPAGLSLVQRVSILAAYGDDLAAVFPLSPLQRAILSQMGLSDQRAYVEQVRLTLSVLDVPKFKDRLTTILDGLDLLRFSLCAQQSDSEIPVQILRLQSPSMEEILYTEDLSGLSLEDAARRINEIELDQAAKLGELDRAPLLHLALLTNPQGGYELSLTSHHLFLDAWSLGLLFGHLLGAYDLDLTVGWADYLKVLSQAKVDEARAFWQKNLARVSDMTELPGFKPGKATGTLAKWQTELPELTALITKAAADLRTTPALFLEAAWAITAARGARVSPISYAVVDNGRNLPLTGVEQILGPCLVTIPRVLDYDRSLTFKEFLTNLTITFAKSITHSTLPLSALLSSDKTLSPSSSFLTQGLMNQVFNYRPFQKWPEGLGIEGINEKNLALGFNLALNWERSGESGHLALEIAYDQGSFEPEAVESIAQSYLNLIEAAAKNPSALIGELPLCSQEMVEHLVKNNAQAVHYPQDWALGAFLKHLWANPQAPAVITKDGLWTYQDLYRHVHHLSQILKPIIAESPAMPIPLGESRPLAAVMTGRSMSYPAALLAIMEAGGAFVPLDYQSPLERLVFQLEQTQARILLTEGASPALIEQIKAARPNLEVIDLARLFSDLNSGPDFSADPLKEAGSPQAARESQPPDYPPCPEPYSLAYVFYTSGTTGRPKGVCINHLGLHNLVNWTRDIYGLGPGQVQGAFGAWTFDVSVFDIFSSLANGAAVYILSEDQRQEIGTIHEAVTSANITQLWLPPQVLRIYMAYYPLKGSKIFHSGGGVFPPPMTLTDQGDCHLIDGYGPTECTVTTSCRVCPPGEWPMDLGYPAANCPIYILDEAGSILPPFFPGELCIGGAQVGLGYLGADELTAQVFRPDPLAHLAPAAWQAGRIYRTGDLAYCGAKGETHFLGRLDRQLKLRGRRLEPAEVEKVLCNHPSVQSALVVKTSQSNIEKLVGYIVWRKDQAADLAGLQTLAAKNLPAWMVPDLWVDLDKLPQTPSGKVDYRALPEPSLTALVAYQAPQTLAEKALIAVLTDILGFEPAGHGDTEELQSDAQQRPPMGMGDDFLSLGGDSVKAIMAVAALEKLGFRLKAAQLYSPGTLKTLAATMEEISPAKSPAPLDLAWPSPAGSADPSFLSTEQSSSIRALFEPAKVAAIHPLTAMQQSMLMARDGAGYHLRDWARIKGRLDPEQLRQNLNSAVQRHEILRSAIVTSGLPRPVMVVLEDRQPPFKLISRPLGPNPQGLSELGELSQTNRADQTSGLDNPGDLSALIASRPPAVNPQSDPLIALTVYRLGEEDHLLALDWHHAIVDGWSLAHLIDELITGPGPEVPRPFRDFIGHLDSQNQLEALEFWRSSLTGCDTASAVASPLGGDGQRDPRPLVNTLPRGLEQNLRALSLARRLTLSNLFQTALGLLLHRYNGQQVQVFCGLDSGRGAVPPQLSSVMGPLINTAPVRLECDPNSSFITLAGAVQSFNLKAQPYVHTPLADIRAATGLDLGDLLMVMENQPQSRSLGQLSVEKLQGPLGLTELGIVVEWVDQLGRLTFQLHYDGSRFRKPAMELLAAHYLDLLTILSQNPNRPVGELDFFSDNTNQALIELSMGPQLKLPQALSLLGSASAQPLEPGPQSRLAHPDLAGPFSAAGPDRLSFFDGFDLICQNHPETLALVGEPTLTYRELDLVSRRLAHDLQLLGCGPGSVVGLHLPRGLEYAAACLGVLRSGAAFLPLDPQLPPGRLAFMVKDSSARAIIRTGRLAPESNGGPSGGDQAGPGGADDGANAWNPELPAVVFDWANFLQPPVGHVPGTFEAPRNRLAYVIYTSGSTGEPKAVLISLSSLTNLALTWGREFGMAPGHLSTLYSPVAFDASIYEIFPALISGGALVAVPDDIRNDPEAIGEFLDRQEVNHSFFPPLIGQAVLKVNPTLNSVTLAGDKPGRLSPAGSGTKIYNAYGPTEFTVCSSAYLVTKPSDNPPIGRPMANCQTLILDSQLRLTPVGLPGQIALSGPQLAEGYLGRPDLTSRSFVPNPFGRDLAGFEKMYLTGDLGFWDFDGQMNFLGRLDHQLKIRGQRLEPGEVERHLAAGQRVEAALVDLVPSAEGLPILTAWIVPKSPASEAGGLLTDLQELEKALRSSLAASLPAWMWPVAYVFLSAFPVDRHGKINRSALPAPQLRQASETQPSESDAPESGGCLNQVIDAWTEVLGFEPGPDEQFLSLGGDSIKAMMAVSSLRDKGFSLDHRDFLIAGTPRRLALSLADQKPQLKKAAAAQLIDPLSQELAPEVCDHFGAARVEDFFPLTPMQEGLLFHLVIEPDSPAYVEQSLFDLSGELDPNHLAEAALSISARHQALRTVFWPKAPGGPLQVVLKDLPPAVTIVPADGAIADGLQSSLKATMESEREHLSTIGSLEKGPLIRLALMDLGQNNFKFLVTFHHLILDGWSFGLWLTELLDQTQKIRAATLKDGFELLGPPKDQAAGLFGDHVRNLLSLRSPQNCQPTLNFWRERLDGLAPSSWPMDTKKLVGARSYRHLDLNMEPLSQDIYSLAKRELVSPATVILALWGIFVSKFRNSTEAVFGLVVSGREMAIDHLKTLGLFINTVPRRIVVEPGETFSHVIQRLEQDGRQIGPQAILTLPEALSQGGFRGPALDIVDHLVAIENLPEPPIPQGLAITSIGGFSHPGYDLAVTFMPSGTAASPGLLGGDIQYSPEVFEPDDMRQLVLSLSYLSGRLLKEPNRPLSDFGLLDASDEAAILKPGLGAPTHQPETLPWACGQKWLLPADPDAHPALVFPGGELSYRELYRRADFIKEHLLSLDLGPTPLVAFHLHDGAAMVVTVLGILKAGAAYLPLETSWPDNRTLDIVDIGKPALLITDGLKPLNWPPQIPILTLTTEGIITGQTGSPYSIERRLPQDLVYVYFTSGSTGRPKGVMISHRSLWGWCQDLVDTHQFGPQDRSLMVFGPAFDAFAWSLYPMLMTGGEVHFPPAGARTDAVAFRNYCCEHNINCSVIPTVMAEAFQLLEPPPSLKVLSTGGDRLDRYVPCPYVFLNEYGPTETTIVVTRHRVDSPKLPIPIGRPLSGVQTMILDRWGHLRPFGLAGELCISGTCLAIGYLGLEELTKTAFGPNPHPGDQSPDYQRLYRTGDRARLRSDGIIEFLGRLDRQVSLGGLRVEPGEIEVRMEEVEGVEQALVVAKIDPAGDNYLLAYLKAKPDEDLDDLAKKVQDHLKAIFPAGMRPKAVIALRAWPMMNNSKVDLSVLPVPASLTASAAGQADQRPANLTELLVLETVKEVLGLDQVELEADFFEQGGDSLKAVRLVPRLETILGRAPALASIINGFSVRSLAKSLEEVPDGRPPVVSAIRSGSHGPAVVLLPDLSGGLWSFRELYESLPPGRAVYAIEPMMAAASDVVEKTSGPQRLPAMMALWTDQVAALEREVILVGLCLTGLNAWELAGQLLDRGTTVRGLMVLNTRTKIFDGWTGDDGAEFIEADYALNDPPESLIDQIVDSFKLYDRISEGAPEGSDLQRRYARAELMAWASYQPQPRDLRLWCVRPQAPFGQNFQPFETRSLGWEALALMGYQEIPSPGHHYDMLGPDSAPHLAALIEDLASEPDPRPREVPLSPIQSWYFSLGPSAWPMFQSLTLKTNRVRPDYIYRLILERLARIHPQLRAVYQFPLKSDDTGFGKAVSGSTILPELKPVLGLVKYPGHPESQDLDKFQHQHLNLLLKQLIDSYAEAKIRALETSNAPKSAAGGRTSEQLLERPNHQPLAGTSPVLAVLAPGDPNPKSPAGDLLHLAIDHMSVDNVSWHLLGRDFSRALEIIDQLDSPTALAAQAALAASLPGQADVGQATWASHLWNLSCDRDYISSQKRYWAQIAAQNPKPLIELLEPDRRTAAPEGSKASFELTLTPDATKALLAKTGSSPQAQILSAVMMALNHKYQAQSLLVLLEGHGREPLGQELDLNSTVGWFTSLYPLVIEAGTDYPATLTALNRLLAEVPQGGIGYGILRHLAQDLSLDLGRRADLVFNYHGDAGTTGEKAGSSGPVSILAFGSPLDLPDTYAPPALLSIDAQIANHQLTINWVAGDVKTLALRELANLALLYLPGQG
jgi:amino acid adenylation domain-containing protein